MAIVEGGRRAVTRYRSLERYADVATAFEAELLTGRTHQVRVHFAANGFPLAGDAVYAAAYRSGRIKREAGLKELRRSCAEVVPFLEELEERKRQFLHATHLGFTHPTNGKRMEFSSALPPDLKAIIVSLQSCRT
jgi:23S rRNA pseudouridine1911/1915/1917 synthase